MYKILEQYISNTVKKEELGSRAFDCLYWYHGPFFYSVLDGDGHERSVIEWSYMDDNSDRWILTTVGDQCDGIQKWYCDDDTGKLLQEPKFQEHQLATPAP